VEVISGILMIFSVALITQSAVAILNRVFYSIQDTKVPLYTGAATIALNISLSYMFYKYTAMNINGIALAYSISSFINMGLLFMILKKKIKDLSYVPLASYLGKMMPPLIVTAAVIFILDKVITTANDGVTVVSKLIQLGTLGAITVIGASVYFALIILFRIPEGIRIYNDICVKIKLKKLVINVNK
jgi:putative peptidoglycan lipid II flippase